MESDPFTPEQLEAPEEHENEADFLTALGAAIGFLSAVAIAGIIGIAYGQQIMNFLEKLF